MAPRENLDVPVLIETMDRPFFPMVRCTYLSVECDNRSPGWSITLEQGTMAFLMIGLVGIIHASFGTPRFYEYRLLDDLFKRLEEGAELLVPRRGRLLLYSSIQRAKANAAGAGSIVWPSQVLAG